MLPGFVSQTPLMLIFYLWKIRSHNIAIYCHELWLIRKLLPRYLGKRCESCHLPCCCCGTARLLLEPLDGSDYEILHGTGFQAHGEHKAEVFILFFKTKADNNSKKVQIRAY
ncbi:hypothetical protein ILYODFUR_035497 [Ilyodon furcidens]|uniref:Uncharacterized protein n=1 Tax=Ilyodon furcidens TaxID=33524 RepID=A0ABV0UPL4_9TELE